MFVQKLLLEWGQRWAKMGTDGQKMSPMGKDELAWACYLWYDGSVEKWERKFSTARAMRARKICRDEDPSNTR